MLSVLDHKFEEVAQCYRIDGQVLSVLYKHKNNTIVRSFVLCDSSLDRVSFVHASFDDLNHIVVERLGRSFKWSQSHVVLLAEHQNITKVLQIDSWSAGSALRMAKRLYPNHKGIVTTDTDFEHTKQLMQQMIDDQDFQYIEDDLREEFEGADVRDLFLMKKDSQRFDTYKRWDGAAAIKEKLNNLK